MRQYLKLLEEIKANGTFKGDRTGTGTQSLFGAQFRVDLSQGFPLLTTKELSVKNIVVELLWMLSGSTNIKPLVEQGVNIWVDWPYKRYSAEIAKSSHLKPYTRKEFIEAIKSSPAFAERWGELGPVYGKQWRDWEGLPDTARYPEGDNYYRPVTFDQIANVMRDLKDDPFSRRHVVSAWNVADIPAMIPSGLPPCHCLFQFNVRRMSLRERIIWQDQNASETKTIGSVVCAPVFSGDVPESSLTPEQIEGGHHTIEVMYKDTPKLALDCQLYQRSCDVFLGVPYNIASYALLTHMIAQQVNMAPGHFIHTFGDVHIYNNHREAVDTQLQREPKELPRLILNKASDLFSYKLTDFMFECYNPHPAIKAPIAV